MSILWSIFQALPYILFYGLIILVVFFYLKDKYQNQHSILKTHPILGRMRYIFEMVGPEFRQYWFLNDKEGKPIDRDTAETIAKAGKYANTIIGFGSKRDFSKTGFYLSNTMFPLNKDELKVDNKELISSYKYEILNESLTSRKEKRNAAQITPWHLTEENQITIGKERQQPFHVKGQIGVSAMSYGALSKSAVKTLAQGVAISGGSFMNTGEGGLAPYHLSKNYEVLDESKAVKDRLSERIVQYVKELPNSSNFDLETRFGKGVMDHVNELVECNILKEKSADLIFQVSSGLFGARKGDGYSEEAFLENALLPEVKAIEMKLAQGAKVRGGKLPKEKNTDEIARIRGIEPGTDVESPNRFPLFTDMESMFDWITHWQEITGKPVGVKVVAGDEHSFDDLAAYMRDSGKKPDFISIDGAEGGTGATYQEMADVLGLPIYSGIHVLDQTLRRYGVRDEVKVIASGGLSTADKMAVALSLGADLIYIARAAMNTVGCINSGKCHTNLCPVGITSHLPHLEAGVVVEEKRFRTANYLRTMREGLFMLGASCGIDSPSKFNQKHIAMRQENNDVKEIEVFLQKEFKKNLSEVDRPSASVPEANSTSPEKEREKELMSS